MRAPLPEVPPHVPKKRDFAKAPLRSLSILCMVQVVFWVLYLFLYTPDPEMSPFWNWTLEGIELTLSSLLLYYLWRGYKLARVIWLWLTFLTLPY